VSAIKVDGKRAYARARAGEDVVLAERPVLVSRFDVIAVRPVEVADTALLDVDVEVTCSTGTYVRALARDVGEVLGVGGHLSALRRTRVGAFDLTSARTLAQLETQFTMTPLDEVAAATFPRRDVAADEAAALSHGGTLPASGMGDVVVAAFGPGDVFIALLEDRDERARTLAVFTD
jgi:tRNA pseudouridine55 synthase